MKRTRTWSSVEEMLRGITLLLQGNPYFAWQQQDGSYRPCYHLAQLEQYEASIFNGEITPGFYAIRPDNLTRWGALDFDNHDGKLSRKHWLRDAQRVFDAVTSKFAECWLLESSPGSFHVIVFAAALLPAAEMRRILLEIVPEGIEVFPKQDAIDTTKPKAKGSLLRFPGKHQRKRTWARIIARSGRIQGADVAAPAMNLKLWQDPNRGSQFLSLYAQVTRDLYLTGSRRRFNAMQTIVGRLKGRTFDEAVAVEIHDRFYNQHRAQIQTPIEKSRRYFLAWFRKAAPCKAELPDYPTTPAEEAKIASLPLVPDVSRDRLRLFLSAKKHSDKTSREFCLSLRLIAQRIGVSIASASNYAAACRKLGIVERLKIGSAYTGKASTYKPGREWPA